MINDLRMSRRARVGVFGIGLEAYWTQFPGLKERLNGYQRELKGWIGQRAGVVSAGIVIRRRARRRPASCSGAKMSTWSFALRPQRLVRRSCPPFSGGASVTTITALTAQKIHA